MNSPIIIGNWKMNFNASESLVLARLITQSIIQQKIDSVEVIICPSFDALVHVGEILSAARISLGAQDVFWQEKGSYTGEISASMLRAAGCSYVIVGHSERRKYMRETDEDINKKIKTALDSGLVPILCVGETLEERREGHADLVLIRQVIHGLQGIQLKKGDRIIVAYEPVWVIGTGQGIDAESEKRAIQVIRQALIDLQPASQAISQTRIIYGGSVDETNIEDYISLPEVSGALVGTASLTHDSFIRLIKRIA